MILSILFIETGELVHGFLSVRTRMLLDKTIYFSSKYSIHKSDEKYTIIFRDKTSERPYEVKYANWFKDTILILTLDDSLRLWFTNGNWVNLDSIFLKDLLRKQWKISIHMRSERIIVGKQYSIDFGIIMKDFSHFKYLNQSKKDRIWTFVKFNSLRNVNKLPNEILLKILSLV